MESNKNDSERYPLRVYKASAGSGKTFTLAVEYISLLALNPMEYQNILAVTFTNKATAEMKQRILSTLFGIGHGLTDAEKYVKPILKKLEVMRGMPMFQDEAYQSVFQRMNQDFLRQQTRAALANIIHDYSRFHIETIDSFFQGIVREIASELELSTNMKVELDEKEVLGEAVDDIIDSLDEQSDEFQSIIHFINERIRSNRSWQVNETIKEFGRNIFKENYLIHGEDVRKTMTDYRIIGRYTAMLEKDVEQWKKRLNDMGKQLLSAYESCGMAPQESGVTIVKFFQKVCSFGNDKADERKELFTESIQKYCTDAGKWFVSKAKNRDTLEPHVVNTLMPMLVETQGIYKEYSRRLLNKNAICQHILALTLLNEINEKVKSLNEESNRFLLSETANFLRNMIHQQDIPFIYEKTGAVIKHIMIDEFQDTSTLQWGNFKPLILNSLSMNGSCLIVGDVKQSIYRFRNSDWRILNNIEADPDLAGQMGTILAEFNYRSSRRVVEFNNKLFQRATQLMQAECPALSTAYNQLKQTPKKDQEAGFVRIENIDYHDIDPNQLPTPWDRQTPPDYSEATLQRILLTVKELLEGGVKPSDITILIRTNKEVPLICDYFNAHQDVVAVKVVSDDAFRLDASIAIHLIITALRALAAQDDKLHLATLAYTYQTLVLNHSDMDSTSTSPFLCDTLEELDTLLPHRFSRQARQELQFKSLPELTEDLYQMFQLERLEHQDAYLFFFHDVVEQFGEDHQTDIDTFLQVWDEKLCEKTIPNGAADGVRIMTMHKSKGLEFHSVIIPSCSWQIKPKDNEVMWCVPTQAPYNQMPLLPVSVNKAKAETIFDQDRRDEELRTKVDNINVLYVAFTRAKNNLVILTGNKIGELFDEKAPIEDAQSFLLRAMPNNMEATDIEGVITTYQCGTIVPTEAAKELEDEHERNVMECDYDPLPVSFVSHPSVAAFRQSYESDLFLTADSPQPQVQQHAERIRLISLGNLYHALFQHIHTAADVPHAVRLLQSKGCFGTLLDADEAAQTVQQLIADSSTTHPEWFSPDWTVLNERAILFLDENNTLTTKRPDRVIVKGNAAIVIDYKTAQGVLRRHPDGTLSAPTDHVNQVKGYRQRLLELGYTDVQAFLWYILEHEVVTV